MPFDDTITRDESASSGADVAIDSAKMTTLDRKAAFFHVIDAHRWLAVSGCAWNLLGAGAENATEKAADQLVPNISVMARDGLLVRARALIKFYRNIGRKTDIILSDFGVPAINQSFDRALEDYEHSIEVHLLHITDWRDFDYRSLNVTGSGATRGRPDWDRDAVSIVALIFETLKWVSEQSVAWQPPFKELYNASTARYRDKSHTWPANLREKSDVEQYLRSLGL